MKLLSSLTFRLAVSYAAILCASFSIIVALFYFLNIELPIRSLQDDLRSEHQELMQTYRSGGMVRLGRALEARRHTEAERFPFHALIDADGKVVTSNLPSWPPTSSSDWLRIEADLHLNGQEEDRDALVLDRRMDDGGRLLLGRNIEDLDDLEEETIRAATTLLPITVALAIIGGAFMGRSVGRRIEALNAAARQIVGSNLSERIPVAGTNDDLDRLAATLNGMLGRLELAVEGIRRTSDSVAHELRTPLARLQSLLEEMLKEQPSSSEGIVQAIREVEALGRMFDAVLVTTRLESVPHSIEAHTVDLSKVLSDSAEFYAGTADERHLRFSTEIRPGLYVRGISDLLFQAACNLLDNAMKYTPSGGAVSLKAHSTDDHVLIVVSDTGPGIPDELHELVTQRFYRAPAATAKPGLGMGLAFVAAVNAVHNARMSFKSDRTGLRVEWRIPREAEPITS